MTGLINPGTDAASRRLFALIFNGLTAGLNKDQWMPLSERHRISRVIYENLRSGGLKVEFVDGLDHLRAVATSLAGEDLTDRP